MEGFNVIPKDNVAGVEIPRNPLTRTTSAVGSELTQKVAPPKQPMDILWWICALAISASIGYTLYVFGMRFLLLSQVDGISKELQQLHSSINQTEIENLKTVDQRLKLINSRLSNHVLTGVIFDAINQNIRATTQISEYKITTSENELSVSLSAIAPTFKDMAEQTERLFTMKDQNLIKSFSITNLAYEQDTKKVRFTIKMVLDKGRYSALGVKVVKN